MSTSPEDAGHDVKRALRTRQKAIRDAIPPALRDEAAERLAAIAVTTLEAALDAHGWCAGQPRIVSTYRAMGSELDPAPLEARLRAVGFGIALPVMRGRDQPLEFRLVEPGAALIERVWGIREPGPETLVVEPDVLAVPLLAFDRQGYRLGYGGGYYDRTLRALRAHRRIIAVGLAFTAQEVDAVPHLDYDERLDWVLTPDGAIACSDAIYRPLPNGTINPDAPPVSR